MTAKRGRLQGAAFLVSALLAVTWATTSVTATIIDRETASDTYEFDAWDCGYRLHVTGTFTDQIQVRADQNPDILHFTTRHDFQETWTADDGRWFTVSGHNLFKDIRAKRVEGTLFEGLFNIPGQPTVITDSSGKMVQHESGNVSFDYTIDFGNGAFNLLSVKVAGPHPFSDTDLCLTIAPLTGGDSAKYLTERPIGSTSFPNGYDEYLPPSYTPTGAKSPLLLFFNGYGENGDGTPGAIERLVQAGIPKYINVGGWDTSRPFVVLAMQHVEEPPGFDGSACRDVNPWNASCNMQLQHDRGNVQPAFCTTPDEVHDFIDYAIANYNVDPARVYITGLSCGGFGIWEYLAKYGASVKAAAAVPIAGDGRPGSKADYCALGSTPIWAFHGALDDVVDPQGSIEPMTALQACPGVLADHAKLTVFPDRDHNSWDPAYGGAAGDIYDWMLGFTKP